MKKVNMKKFISISLSTFLLSSQLYTEKFNLYIVSAAENKQTLNSNVNVNTTTASAIAVPAFPGAEGYGAYTVGGRGGDIYHVTTLNSTGPGSLYEGITTGTSPRTIVFDVAGYIDMPHFTTDRSNLTIEGQTAPGEGVCVRTGGGILFQNSNDIIIRYLRFRRAQQSSRSDCLDFNDDKNIIVDHCSFSWGNDEVFSIQNCQNVTVQWSIMAEGPRPHSMGGLIQGNTISMHHNLYAHNNDRNPKAKGDIDFVNNVVYNWGDYPFVAGGDSAGISRGNVVGNYFIAGKDSKNPQYAITRGNENFNLFLSGNYIDSDLDGTLNGKYTGIGMMQPFTDNGVSTKCTIVDKRFTHPLLNTESAIDAYNHVVDKSGASIARDRVDKGIIDTLTNQTGKILDTDGEAEVGGFLPLQSGDLKQDTDNDGIPDEWESSNGLNPKDDKDAAVITSDGYTNLEHYLNSVAAAGFPNNTPPSTLSPAPVIVPPTPLKVFKFDFGTANSPVADGYTKIDESTRYDAEKGYGWADTSNVSSADHMVPDKLREDYCGVKNQKLPIVFNVDLPNGGYSAKVISGDFNAAQTTTVSAEGGTPVSLASNANVFTEKIIPVTLTDGQLNLTFANNVRVCSIEILQNPSVPSGLGANEIECDKVALNWSKVDGAEYYKIYRASSVDNTYTQIGQVNSAEFTDYTVAADATYNYKVSAIIQYAESNQSDVITVTTKKLGIPSQPLGFTSSKVKSMSAVLTWDKLTSAESYNIYRKAEGESRYSKIDNSTLNSYIDKTVVPNTTYYYEITAVNVFGESVHSDEIILQTLIKPDVPTVPTGINAEVGTASAIKVSWNAVSKKEGYNIFRKEEGAKDYVKIGTSEEEAYFDTATKSNVTYYYMVSAFNESGESDKCTPASAKRGLISYKFDFGMDTSIVAPGYIGINQKSKYDTALGYGWNNITSSLQGRSRAGRGAAKGKENDSGYPVLVDFCLGKDVNFNVDLINGYYNLKIISGDYTDPNKSNVSFNGEEAQQLNSSATSFKELNYVVKITNGQLSVDMGGDGRINCLEINEIDKNSDFSKILVKTLNFKDKSGNDVSSLTSEGVLEVNAKLMNSSNNVQPITMIAALYDVNNTLIAKAYGNDQIDGEDMRTFNIELTLPKKVSGCYIRVFVWDNLDNMIPLTKPITFPN